MRQRENIKTSRISGVEKEENSQETETCSVPQKRSSKRMSKRVSEYVKVEEESEGDERSIEEVKKKKGGKKKRGTKK